MRLFKDMSERKEKGSKFYLSKTFCERCFDNLFLPVEFTIFYFVLALEHVVATDPDTFVIPTTRHGSTAVYCGDIKEKGLTEIMTMTAIFPSQIVSTVTNGLFRIKS